MIIRISYVFLRDLMRVMVRFFAIFIRINLLLFNQLLIRPLVRVVRWRFLLMHRLSVNSRREKRFTVGIDTLPWRIVFGVIGELHSPSRICAYESRMSIYRVVLVSYSRFSFIEWTPEQNQRQQAHRELPSIVWSNAQYGLQHWRRYCLEDR